MLQQQTLAHFLIRSVPSSFVFNYIHTNIVSELYMQRLRIPWSLETLCQGPSPKLHNPPFRLLPYSAFCPLPFLMCSTPLWILASSAFLHSLSQKVFKKIVENHNHIWLLLLVNMLIQDQSLHSCQWLSIPPHSGWRQPLASVPFPWQEPWSVLLWSVQARLLILTPLPHVVEQWDHSLHPCQVGQGCNTCGYFLEKHLEDISYDRYWLSIKKSWSFLQAHQNQEINVETLKTEIGK